MANLTKCAVYLHDAKRAQASLEKDLVQKGLADLFAPTRTAMKRQIESMERLLNDGVDFTQHPLLADTKGGAP